jgi:hypothetical protein
MGSPGICYLRRGLKISINGPYLVVILLLLRPREPKKASAFSREAFSEGVFTTDNDTKKKRTLKKEILNGQIE